METMERHRGHFYNWYDTQSLRPLFPLYISSVDSGNLAGHLLTLAPGLRELADLPIVGQPPVFRAADTLAVVWANWPGVRWPIRRAELKKELDQASGRPTTHPDRGTFGLLALARTRRPDGHRGGRNR